MKKSFIEFQDVVKTYGSGDTAVNALSDVSFSLGNGEFVVILGPSGAGKTTLLNLLGGMDSITSGKSISNKISLGAYSNDNL